MRLLGKTKACLQNKWPVITGSSRYKKINGNSEIRNKSWLDLFDLGQKRLQIKLLPQNYPEQ